MKNILGSKSYWIVSVLAAGFIFLAFLGLGKTYRSETDILILAKDPAFANNTESVAENAVQISRTLTFYDAVLQNDPAIKDPMANTSAGQRKNYWQKEIQAEKLDNSGAVKFIIYDKDPLMAENFSRAIFPVLSQELGKYYSADAGVDLKTMDAPLLSRTTVQNYPMYGLLSLLISFSAIFLSFILSDALVKRKRRKKIFSIPKKVDPKSQKRTPEEAQERLNQLLEGEI